MGIRRPKKPDINRFQHPDSRFGISVFRRTLNTHRLLSRFRTVRSHMPAFSQMRPPESGALSLLRPVYGWITACMCKVRSPANGSTNGTVLRPDSKGYRPALPLWGLFTSPVPPDNGFLSRCKWSVGINVETQITPSPSCDFSESKRRTYTYGSPMFT